MLPSAMALGSEQEREFPPNVVMADHPHDLVMRMLR